VPLNTSLVISAKFLITEEALRFDKINHSTKWADAMKLEMSQLNDYKCFNHDPIPEG
jgi:hypothetical protein